MHERRWPWVVTSTLLLAAAVAAAGSTYLHWLPCRGALLSGSLLQGYQDSPGPGFSDACLQRMDAGGLPFPYPRNPSEQTAWGAELGVLAMLLAGTAWLVLVLGVRWSLRTKAVAVLPALAALALAVASRAAAADPSRTPEDSISGWLEVAPEAAALVALTAIWHWQPEVQEGGFVQVVVVAWGASAFGSAHMVVEYVFMVGFSTANWDVPPLTGLFTVITLTLSAVLPLMLGAGGASRCTPARRDGDEEGPSPAFPQARGLVTEEQSGGREGTRNHFGSHTGQRGPCRPDL